MPIFGVDELGSKNFLGTPQDQTKINTGGNRGANQDTSFEIIMHTNPQRNLGPGGTQQKTQTTQTKFSNPKTIVTSVAAIIGVAIIGKILYDNISNKF